MTGIIIPKYPNPFDPSNQLVNAFATIGAVSLDNTTGLGSLVLNVYANQAAATGRCRPDDELVFALGQQVLAGNPSATPPVQPVALRNLAGFMVDAAFASAFGTISAEFFGELISKVPPLAGSTPA